MKKFFLISLFISFSHFSFSQNSQTNEHQIYIDGLAQTTKTLIINTTNLSMNTLGELKDELIVWKEKVISININEQTREFILQHNELLDDRELFDVLKKYDIQKKHITSYK